MIKPSFACLLLGATALASAGGCSSGTPGTDTGSDIRQGERSIVGDAVPYKADLTLRGREEELRGSMRKRREVAWQAVSRALKDTQIPNPKDPANGAKVALPSFRTWYGRDDFQRIFASLWDSHSPTARRERKPFSKEQIASAVKLNYTSRGSWNDADYLDRIAQLTDNESIQGLAGNGRVSYSPGYVRHFFENYGEVYNCLNLLPTITNETAPPSATNFAQCYRSEFDEDAAVIKASYYRANIGTGAIPVRPTDATSLAKRMQGTVDSGGWGKGSGEQKPKDGAIYSVRMSDGNAFYLPGIHLITKELRDWLWVTLWWSPSPNEDFGADRPEEIKALGGPWSNYKMCVSMAYEEGDADPRGGFTGSLGDALQATYGGVGGPTWCSNPYIEKGERNGQTNCIGCHQHAGDSALDLATMLTDDAKFPKAGRTKQRLSFPTDYTWSFNMAPEAFAEIIRKQVDSR
jgi:hypothetical protein